MIDGLKDICNSLGVKRIFILGSAASGNFNEDSDTDFLVSFSETLSPANMLPIILNFIIN